MVRVKRALPGGRSRLIWPNCPAVLTPGEYKIGIMPGSIFKKGSVGVVSRSGTLTYEVAFQTSNAGLGQTTAVRFGGDPVTGTKFIGGTRPVPWRSRDRVDHHGREIGGSEEEEEEAQFLRDEAAKGRKKPMAGFDRRPTAPLDRRIGYAGAIVSGGKGRRGGQGRGEPERAGFDVGRGIAALTRGRRHQGLERRHARRS